MHIPENYLSPSTCGIFTIGMVPIWTHAIKRTRETVPGDKVTSLGVAAAFCFVAMMFNIPIPGGTTGHAVCGTLVAILFGPWPATLALSIALAIQAVFFGDGGILALGTNCFNVAFVLPHAGYAVYSLISRHVRGEKGDVLGAAIGSYVGINAAALCAALEFGVQPLLFTDAAGNALYCPYPISISVPAMMAGHLTVWGVAEATFTVGILTYLRKVAPGFGISLSGEAKASQRRESRAVLGLIAVLVVATPLGLIAKGDAWGEWSIEQLSQLSGETPSGMANGWEWKAFLPDYSLGSLPEAFSYILSAVIGVALLVLIFRLIAATMRPRIDFGTTDASKQR